MNTNPFVKCDPFIKYKSFNKYTIINNKSSNQLISTDLYSQSDIIIKFKKLIKNKNKEFLLHIQLLLQQELLRF